MAARGGRRRFSSGEADSGRRCGSSWATNGSNVRRAEKQDFDRRPRTPQDRGDAPHRHVFDVEQPQGGCLFFGECLRRQVPKALTVFSSRQNVERFGGGRRGRVHRRRFVGDGANAAAMVDARPPGDREQPGGKRPPRTVAVEILICAEKRLLREVLGVGVKTPMPQKMQHRGLKSPQ